MISKKAITAKTNGFMLRQDHTCAGLTAAAARDAVKAIADEATALGCTVNVRVLSYDEAAAVQVTSFLSSLTRFRPVGIVLLNVHGTGLLALMGAVFVCCTHC